MARGVRAFIAIEVPAEVQEHAGRLIQRLRVSNAKVKWVPQEQLHWTLKFLGEIDLNEVPEICAAMSAAVGELAPFDVEALGAGAFPDVRSPRTVWIGMGRGSEETIDLHGAIERSLAKLGYRTEGRRFRPHLTIGRVRNSPLGIPELGKLIEQNAQFEGGLSSVFEVTVFSSELGREGPTYTPLAHVELSGR